MRRYFLRVYLGIAIALFMGAFATLFMANRQFESMRQERFYERLTDEVLLISQVLEGLPDAETRAEWMREWSGPQTVGIQPISRLAISPDDLARVRSGEAVALFVQDRPTAYRALSASEVLVLSRPPRPDRFFGIDLLHLPDIFFLALQTVILLLIGVAIYVLVRPLEQRIYALTEAAERFGQGDLGSRVQAVDQDGIANLVHTFNGMAERIEVLVESQKELLQAVSHEFRTPLARLFFVVDEAQEAETPAEKNAYLLRIQQSLNGLNDLVEELLAYARLDKEAIAPEFEPVNICAAMREMPDLVMELRQDIAVDVECEEVEVFAVRRYFKRALQNLVSNAVRHAKSGVWISGRVVDEVVHVVVEDDGEGIPAHQREKVFEPFARLDKSRNLRLGGIGLGLAIVKRIMDLHRGEVSVDESSRGGARFTLSFALRDTRSVAETGL